MSNVLIASDEEQSRLSKNRAIAQSGKETRDRRSLLDAKTYEVKINSHKLTQKQKSIISRMCLEHKWFYNDVVSYLKKQNELSSYDTKVKTVMVKLGRDSDKYDNRDLSYLSASMKQLIKTQISDSLRALGVLKSHGRKVGSINYRKDDITSLLFRQPDIDFSIDFKRNSVKLSKIGAVKVRGLRQISQDAEIAGRLKLIIKPSGYYLNITAYELLRDYSHVSKGSIVGIDMGIKTMLTTSDNIEYHCNIPHSDRLKKLQRKLSRQVKGSHNHKKTLNSIKVEYEKITRKKKDYANKTVHELLNSHRIIIIQDENIKGWHSGLFGRQVQSSALGRIKAKLVALQDCERVVVIPRWCATTQLCLGEQCGRLNRIPLSQRVYSCECGYTETRDVHSAKSMIHWAKNLELLELKVQ